ncbi:MAG: type I 3-dehydroquinate dehydratase [Planctomycetes bacterium]|nr:type I 3-dehydroquinate dehydratase [Planctomycetota bacterium]
MTRRPPTTPRTLICVPIMVHDVDEALHDAQRSKSGGADLVEFRIDDFFTGDAQTADREERELLRLVASSPLACIVTCRSKDEGGHYDGTDEARISLYERLGTASGKIGDLNSHPPRYLDIEAATYLRSANLAMKVNLAVAERDRDDAPWLIASMHDFATRPPDLLRRLAAARQIDKASVLKVAYRARSLRDSLELLDLCREADSPTIALGMGEYGTLSRILAPKFGGFLTFASLAAQSATAPGQPTLSELTDLYRFRSIKPSTRVYGIIGSPVSHSLSPKVHNAGFELLKQDAVYVPLPIAASDDLEASYISFKATMWDLIHHSHLNFCGASVTLPHKENLVRLARAEKWKLDTISDVSGSANTLVVDRSNPAFPRCSVFNTDVRAVSELLDPHGVAMSGGAGHSGRPKALVIGAGGVGRAIAHGLARDNCHVTIANRTIDKAQAIVNSIALSGFPNHARSAYLETIKAEGFHFIIQCTSVGMVGPNQDQTPVSPEFWNNAGNAAVLETIYTPRETPFVKDALAAGCRVHYGRDMFILQALAQMMLWVPDPDIPYAPPPEHLAAIYERLTR